MTISKEERERFERQARSLREIETDSPGTPEQRQRMLELVNYLRVGDGFEPLTEEDEEEFPELGFFRRAQALGIARIRRKGT